VQNPLRRFSVFYISIFVVIHQIRSANPCDRVRIRTSIKPAYGNVHVNKVKKTAS